MDACPYCQNPVSTPYISLKDDFLTKEPFEIVECSACHLLYTTPRPDTDHIGAYYESDEYLSHQENKSGLVPSIYEAVKSVNIKRKVKLATQELPIGSLLDIGCGVGDFLLAVSKTGWNIAGIEPSEHAKAIASQRLGFTPLDPTQTCELSDASFDVITMWHVLEHVDQLHEQLHQLERLLKPGGRLVIALPNYQSYDANYYREHWAAWDVPRHLNHFSKETLTHIVQDFHFKFIDFHGLKWDSYYISYLSERYLGHRAPLLKGAYRGFVSNLKAHQSGMYSSLVYRFTKIP